MEGIIKKVTKDGYGFIGVEGQEKDVFFHSKGLVNVRFDDLHEGERVSFDIEDGARGPSAVNVQLV